MRMTSNFQKTIECLIDRYIVLVDLCIRKQKDFEYSFSGYSNIQLANMLEHKSKFEFNIEEVIGEIRELAKTHRYKVVYDNINLFIFFARSYGESMGNLYQIEPHLTSDELSDLYYQRKISEEKLVQHIEDYKDFVNVNWDPKMKLYIE